MVEALSRENLLEFLRMWRLSSNSKDRKPLEWMIVVRSALAERVIRKANRPIHGRGPRSPLSFDTTMHNY